MKLNDALNMGYECGLVTVREALANVEMHAGSLFCYEDIEKELEELYNECWECRVNATDFIEEIIISPRR